jgi:hypothetical protein
MFGLTLGEPTSTHVGTWYTMVKKIPKIHLNDF